MGNFVQKIEAIKNSFYFVEIKEYSDLASIRQEVQTCRANKSCLKRKFIAYVAKEKKWVIYSFRENYREGKVHYMPSGSKIISWLAKQNKDDILNGNVEIDLYQYKNFLCEDKDIAYQIRQILSFDKEKSLDFKEHNDFLNELTFLLFFVESIRNPFCFVIHQMALDLVIAGKVSWKTLLYQDDNKYGGGLLAMTMSSSADKKETDADKDDKQKEEIKKETDADKDNKQKKGVKKETDAGKNNKQKKGVKKETDADKGNKQKKSEEKEPKEYGEPVKCSRYLLKMFSSRNSFNYNYEGNVLEKDKEAKMQEFSNRTMKIIELWMQHMKEEGKINYETTYDANTLISAVEQAENFWYSGISVVENDESPQTQRATF